MTSLNPVLHSAPRIAIVTRLLPHRHLRFAALREELGMTAGNLASHLLALERAQYVRQSEVFFALCPGKIVALTDEGRLAVTNYIAQLERLLEGPREPRPADPGEASGGPASPSVS